VLQEVDGNTGEIKAHYTDNPGYWGGLTSLHTEGSTPSTRGAQFNAATFGSAGFNQSATSSSSGSFYYLFDLQASTRQLTDASGNVSDAYTYRAFGKQELDQGTTRNPHRFQGQVGPYTDAVNRVWMRARIYGPNTGQWLSRDPIGFEGGSWNLYKFVGNEPVVGTDPWGLFAWCCNIVIKSCCPQPKPKLKPCANTPPMSSSSPNPYNKYQYYMGVPAGCMFLHGGDGPWGQIVRGCLICMYRTGATGEQAHDYCYDRATQRVGQIQAKIGFATAVKSAAECKCGEFITDFEDVIKDAYRRHYGGPIPY
jgi:RHS repeat-associated protein